jgi:hypothetical protein
LDESDHELIARNRGINLGRPGINSAPKIGDLGKAT